MPAALPPAPSWGGADDAALADTAVDMAAVDPGLPAQGQAPPHGGQGADLPAAALSDVPNERQGPCLAGWFAVLTALSAAAVAGWLLWHAGLLPQPSGGLSALPRSPHGGTGLGLWSGLAVLAALAAFVLLGLTRGRPGSVWVLTRCGAYRGTVRRTGLLWISPLLRRRRIDVTLRHWRSRPIGAVDATGTPLQITVLVVWRVRDSARAAFAVHDHSRFLRETVEAALARAVSRRPADDFRGAAPTLRDCDRLADELQWLVTAALRPAGVEVFSATPVRIDYAPEVAAAMRRARIAALDARQRKAVLDDVLASVADTVRGISERGLAQLDEYERKALVRDLTVSLLSQPAAPAPGRARLN
ncbi:SPFH domain-containing protein [Streptomyces sp. V4-01]|uniref:SPFH domain-containing protein n=1 Tax=Actinacidiphila polyblastidii TaxID=3110430 RepID=A0ABU7P9N9_9ACTN|nr:SPFH domain-containing protein [Streptomyces sp. V4-01]